MPKIDALYAPIVAKAKELAGTVVLRYDHHEVLFYGVFQTDHGALMAVVADVATPHICCLIHFSHFPKLLEAFGLDPFLPFSETFESVWRRG